MVVSEESSMIACKEKRSGPKIKEDMAVFLLFKLTFT